MLVYLYLCAIENVVAARPRFSTEEEDIMKLI
jgi:hypothetical protein